MLGKKVFTYKTFMAKTANVLYWMRSKRLSTLHFDDHGHFPIHVYAHRSRETLSFILAYNMDLSLMKRIVFCHIKYCG